MSYSRRPALRTVVWTVALALQLGLLVVVGNKMAISGDGLRASTVAHRYTVRPAETWLVDSEGVGPTTSQRVDAPIFTRVAVETGQTRFEGYGVPGTMVDLVVDGQVVGATGVDHLGRWLHSWRVLAPGDHRIEARSTDKTGLRALIGETIGVAIPQGFVGGTLLEAEPPSPQIRTQVAPNETRRRAEALAAAAEDAYAQVAQAQGWTRLAQADSNSTTRTDGGGSVRSAPPTLRRSSDAVPPKPDTGLLAPVTNWLDQASRSYHTIIVPRLSSVRETEAVAPSPHLREPERSPVRTVQSSSGSDVPPPPVRTLRDGSTAPGTSGTASVLDDVRGWLQRASRDYRTIVRGLANPDSSLIEAQRERRPAPTRVRTNDSDERRREIAEARKADEERRAAEARARERDDRRTAAQAPAAPAAQAPGAATQLQRQEDDRRAEEARQAEALRRQAEASRRADEARIAEMQRAEQERLARDARERAEAQKRAEELAAAQARQREAEAARRADEQRRLQAAREDAQERARREAAARAAEAQAARERAMETARQEAEAARERAAAEARRQAEAERQRAADAERRARESQQAEARAQARAQAEAQARAEAQAQAQAQAQARARDEAERRAREAAVRERAQALARTANETRETIRIPDTAARSAPTAQEDNVLEAARRQAVEILKRERLIMAERTGPDRAPAARAPSISAPQPPTLTPLAEAREKAMALIRSERERIASMKSRQREQADALRRAAAAPKVRSRDEVIEQGSATRGPVGDSARRIAGRLSDRERSSLGAGGVATARPRQRAGASASCRRAGRKVRTPGFYIVAPGDTLWDIAERHYDDGSAWRRIRAANRRIIDDVDLIRPCQRLRLPGS